MTNIVWRRVALVVFVAAALLPTVRLVQVGQYSLSGAIGGLLIAALILVVVTGSNNRRLRRAVAANPHAYVTNIVMYPDLGWEIRAALPGAPRLGLARSGTLVVDEHGVRVLVGGGLRVFFTISRPQIASTSIESALQGNWRLSTVVVQVVTADGALPVHFCLMQWGLLLGHVVKGPALDAELRAIQAALRMNPQGHLQESR